MDNQNFYKVFKLEQNDKVSVVKLPESVLGGNDAMNFTNAIKDLDKNSTSALLVDLSDVKVMNSSGLGMLVGALRNLQGKAITMALVSTPAIVASLLEMTHLKKVFKLYESIEDAVSNLE